MAKKKAADAAVNEAPATETVATTEPKLKHDKKLALLGTYTDASEITWHITKNPRSPGKATAERFAKYFGAATVGAYVAAGGTKGDLLWDLRAGYLSIEGVTLTSEPQPKKEKAPKAEKTAKAKKEVAPQMPADEVAEEVIG